MKMLPAIFLAFLGASLTACCFAADTVAPRRAFPGAHGFAAFTPGGRGGRIVRVTTLDATGAGSLREALQAKGPRIVVFEVGGVIDLDGKTLTIAEPFLTIAGQTAPSSSLVICWNMAATPRRKLRFS
ncbi:MAG: hypothetical protein FJ395_10240 [Verrucomicrobia bacterium]|nr:hypothetical protein [Verrucomicrobiota bacterium]